MFEEQRDPWLSGLLKELACQREFLVEAGCMTAACHVSPVPMHHPDKKERPLHVGIDQRLRPAGLRQGVFPAKQFDCPAHSFCVDSIPFGHAAVRESPLLDHIAGRGEEYAQNLS
ncbi:hypothetical protein D3C71_1879410 [compost metagenome]